MATEEASLQTVQGRRDNLRSDADCTFVEREEFCRLLVSSRKLIWANDPAANLRGLLDPETGARFLIEQERLLPAFVDPRDAAP